MVETGGHWYGGGKVGGGGSGPEGFVIVKEGTEWKNPRYGHKVA